MSQLPDDSRLVTWEIDRARDEPRPPARRGRAAMATVRWGQEHHLLADIRDLLTQLDHTMRSVAQAQSGHKPDKPPAPLPRPTDPTDQAAAKLVGVHKRVLDRFADRWFTKKGADDGEISDDGDPAAADGLPAAEKGPRPIV